MSAQDPLLHTERDRRPQDSSGHAVTVVVIRDVVPSREGDYDGWAHRVVSAAGRYGATGHTIITPDAAAPARRVIVQHFSEVR